MCRLSTLYLLVLRKLNEYSLADNRNYSNWMVMQILKMKITVTVFIRFWKKEMKSFDFQSLLGKDKCKTFLLFFIWQNSMYLSNLSVANPGFVKKGPGVWGPPWDPQSVKPSEASRFKCFMTFLVRLDIL